MKKQLIYTALLAAAPLLLSSCFDEEKTEAPAAEAPAPEEQPQEPAAPTCPTDEEISAGLADQLPASDVAERGDFTCEPPQTAEDGSVSLTVHQTYTVRENLYTRESAPEAFNELRKGINDAVNAATKPESVYLLQVGGTTDMLTDADRAPKPLPEDLQAKANELKDLAEGSVWTQARPAGETIEVLVHTTARYEEGAWKFEGTTVEDAALQPLNDFKAESAVTSEGAFILNDETMQSRKAEIAEKIEALNAAAEPYINSREDAARNRLTQEQAAAEEAAHKAAEEQAAAEAVRQQWVDACTKAIASGKNFSGEWTRDNRFGELTLHIEQAKSFDGSIQFIGTLYDTKLPEASLDIAGRCDLAPGEGGAHVDVTIYDGRYDPDQPTAEVYDARDGLLSLVLTQDGKLTGIMSCGAWAETPEKAFRISLSPKAEAAKDSGKNRRRR
ncbi:MAG: hypothetical protein MJ051_03385 [Akkermansia sp.]|nr:hypothetical protein [Akkermansia sp.]